MILSIISSITTARWKKLASTQNSLEGKINMLYKDWEEDKKFLKEALPVILMIPIIYVLLVILFSFAD